MRNISNKSCWRKSNTRFIFVTFLRQSLSLCDSVENNIVERYSSQMTVWRMRIACRYLRLQNPHSEYVMHIAFPLNNGCTNAFWCFVIRPLPALFTFYSLCSDKWNAAHKNPTPVYPYIPVFWSRGTSHECDHRGSVRKVVLTLPSVKAFVW